MFPQAACSLLSQGSSTVRSSFPFCRARQRSQAGLSRLPCPRQSGASVGPIGSFQVEVSPLQLVVSEPVGDVVAGSTFDLAFSAEDALGNVDTEFDGPMSFQLTNAVGD